MSLLPVGVIPLSGYNINNSLRLRASASAQLTRTPASASNRTTWTFSAWIKRGTLVDGQSFFGVTTSGNDNTQLRFSEGSGLLNLRNEVGGGATIDVTTTSRVFRDPSAWYHIIIVFDSTNATQANRCVMYVNGESQALSNTSTIALNETTYINSTVVHSIGYSSQNLIYFDGYLAEVNFIDGQALSASSFGSTNATTGVWQPIKYTGTYGTNGFYQKYSNADSSAVLVNTSSAVQDTAATTITVNVPSGTVNNTLMILLVTSAGTANNWTTPAGWTAWSSNFNGRAIYYRTASSEPASYTITQSGSATSAAYILTYNNATIDVMGSYGTAANPSVAPSITTTANNATVFYFVASGGQDTNTYSTPTNFTPLVSDLGPTRPCSAAFSRVQATAGATGTASSTIGTGLPFSLQFAIKPISNTNLGLDFSGNGNNYTTTNISVTTGATYDAMIDSPTLTSATVANYPVLNPISRGTDVTISNGNLSYGVTALTNCGAFATIGMSSGKWYCEFTAQGNDCMFGLALAVSGQILYLGINAFSWGYYRSGNKYNNGTNTAYGAAFTTNDVIGITFDADIGTLVFYKNNVSQGAAFTGLTSGPYFFATGNGNIANSIASANFGQRPFVYTPPTGFKALNTYNLPDSTIKKGNSYMDATLYTGTGASRSVTNTAGFRPDFVWVKGRSGATDHALYDFVRGTTNDLVSNSTAAATTQAQGLTAFNSNGFTVGTLAKMNTNAATYVGWQWQAGQGTNTTNTAGTITSTVSVNATAGFSVVTYTGVATSATIGHGLGVAPKFIIVKSRSVAGANWGVYHASLGAANKVNLNTTAASAASSNWNSTAPTSSVFSVGSSNSETNGNGTTFVAYCWSEIAGFSRFGSYTGNGSTDGPFVYLGFRPKFVLVKVTSAANDWDIYDSSRNPFNLAGLRLQPNSAGAEVSMSNIDLLSNGFKWRNNTNTTEYNGNGSTYIYAAFAENPFKNALAR